MGCNGYTHRYKRSKLIQESLIMKKKILILNTGGTISSVQTETGYEPAPGYIAAAMLSIPAFRHPDLPSYHIEEYNPLLDSSNMTVYRCGVCSF